MNRNFHNSRGSSAHAGNQNPRWRTVFLALVLALAIGSARQPVLAQKAGTPRVLSTRLSTSIPNNIICLYDIVTVEVTPVRAVEIRADKTIPFDRRGIAISASVEDPAIVTLLGESELASLRRGSTSFNFRGDKEGTTSLIFSAVVSLVNGEVAIGSSLIEPNKAVTSVFVKVIPCEYKVKTLLEFPVEIYDITVISDNAVMKADESGTFTGSTSMYWVYSNFNLAPCTIEIGATDSQVDLTGQLDEDGGQFMATQTFQPQTVGGIVTCPGGSGGGSGAFTVAPLTFSVASSGGVVTQTATADGVSGLATIVVVPEEGKAVSFIPEDPEASWDDFSSLFGALLALY